MKQKEHSQGKCHHKGTHVDNIDIPLGFGAHLQVGWGTPMIDKWSQNY